VILTLHLVTTKVTGIHGEVFEMFNRKRYSWTSKTSAYPLLFCTNLFSPNDYMFIWICVSIDKEFTVKVSVPISCISTVTTQTIFKSLHIKTDAYISVTW